MRMISQVGDWFERRLQLAAGIRETAEHRVPRNTASWFYVFGSGALTVFVLQIVTGILLALSTFRPPPKPGTPCKSLIMTSPSAGSFAPSTAGAPTSWSPSC